MDDDRSTGELDLSRALKSEPMLVSMLESSNDCTKIVSLDGRLLFMNRNGCRLMALPCPDAVVGADWAELWPTGLQGVIRGAVGSAAAGESVRFQGECPTAAGELRFWDVSVSPLQSRDGVIAVLATSRDITELVQARHDAEVRETAICRQGAALKAAGVLARLGGWEIDFRTGQVFWSEEVWNLLGGEPREVALEEAMTIYRPEDRPWIAEQFEHARLTGERISFEAEVSRFDGSKIWASIIGEPAFEDGVCTVLRGAAQDITEARQAMDQLARTERRLKMAIELANLHVFEVDYHQRRLFNQGAEDTFFETPMTYERMWRDPFSGIDPRDRPEVESAWRAAEACGRPLNVEYRVERSDGREIWANSVAILERGADGGPARLVGAMKNVTLRKQAEQQMKAARDLAEAASAAKSAFLANISHEIRTPLNGILGMAQVMERAPLDAEQRERVQVIRQAGETLKAILNNVLDISKIEAGRLEIADHPFDLRRCLDAACRPFTDLAAQKDIGLAIDISPAADACWRGDEMRLRQVVGNLVSNAIKFTDHGQVRVTAQAAGAGLVLIVADTGVGIPPDRLDGLFEKFKQVDESATRRFGGTGLGLAISRDLVELMGGAISVDSRPGEGTSFRVELPLGAGAAAPARPAEHGQPTGLALRVLAAEDNPVNQLILRSLVEPLGLELTIVCDGEQAVEAAKGDGFDLVLMDIQMPKVDGIEATRRIRAWEAACGRPPIPILALSANVLSHQTQAYVGAGMNGVVPKPIELGELLEAIAQVSSAMA